MYRAACADCDPCVALWLRCVAKSPAPSWNRRRVCRRSRPDRTAQRTCRATRAGCVSKLGRAVQRAVLGQHTDARQWRREHYIRNPYLHTCRVKISTFPWRPVSISARSSRLLLRLRLWDCADCGPHLPLALPASSAPICAETCNWASDADCDDGGPGLGSARPGPTACGRPDHRLIC